MTTKSRIVASIIFLLLIGGHIFATTGMEHIEKRNRRQELSLLQSYEVFEGYVPKYDVYEVFVMCNPEYTLPDIIALKFTDEYFKALKSHIDGAESSHAPTTVYMMFPSEDLPYGWEKSELNIVMNFDQTIFYKHTTCVITIPYGANAFEECSVEYRN